MVRGEAEYIISKETAATLYPHHPRIRRSAVATLAITAIIDVYEPPHDGSRITPSKPAPFVKQLVKTFNWRHLRRKDDLLLNYRNVWRIYFRRVFGRVRYFQTKSPSRSHKGLYFQTRHSSPDEIAIGRQKRKKSSSTIPIGPDYRTIEKVTTIDQAGSPRIIYTTKNLHARYHGSIDQSDVVNNLIIYNFVGVANKTLSQKNCGRRGVGTDGDIVVGFSNAAFFRNMTKKLGRFGYNIPKFEIMLAKHIIAHGLTVDLGRCEGTINPNEPSINQRARFGFGRIQKAIHGINMDLDGTPAPGANVKDFLNMPQDLQDQLVLIFEASTLFTRTWLKDSFTNSFRNEQCAGTLNNAMGYPTSSSLFEYFEIVVTRNTILKKHCDAKNDHREGYNICTVYSYYTTIDDKEVKVSIIMTSRSTVGSAVDNCFEKLL